MFKIYRFFFYLTPLLFIKTFFAFCDDKIDPSSSSATETADYPQWFVGSVFTPNATTLSPGHPALELVACAGATYARFNSHGHLQRTPRTIFIRPFFDFQAGINKIFGAELLGFMITNFRQGESTTHLQDTMFRFGIQLSNDEENSWIPDSRILFQEIFPTGKYQRLNPQKKGTDCSGQGSFQTGAHFLLQKLFFAHEEHPLQIKLSIGYFIPSSVQVRGLNYFGGSSKTRGTVHPGRYSTNYFFAQYAVSRKLALACEMNYQTGEKGRFSRKRGPKIEVLSFNQWSIIPEVQYTFSPHIGLVAGNWSTFAGKNSTVFTAFFTSILFCF